MHYYEFVIPNETSFYHRTVILEQLGNGVNSVQTNTVDLSEEKYEEEAAKTETEVTNKVSELFSSPLFSQAGPKEVKAEDKVEEKEEKDTEPEENKVLVNYASLTQEELEVAFGDYKPCASLNPYMVKAWSFNSSCFDEELIETNSYNNS